jgi:LPXTG-motif cell wall-anchored protein
MRRLITLVAIATFLVAALAQQAVAVDVTAKDLVDNGEAYDGMTVTVVGELIGDYGQRRGGYTWTQLNEDAYVIEPIARGGVPAGGNIGIGVTIPTPLMEGLDAPGRYRQIGPVVSLTGVWKYHDPARHGESFLRVAELTRVRNGEALSEPPDWAALIAGAVLILGGAALLLVRRRSDSST